MNRETRDHQIGQALEAIQVPELSEDFWRHLSAREPTLTDPLRPRRAFRLPRAQRRLLVVGVAAVLAFGVAAAVLATHAFDKSAPKPEVSAAVASGEQCCLPGETQVQWYRRYLKLHPEVAAAVAKRQRAWARIASRITPSSTGVRTLLAYHRVKHALDLSDLPQSVSEAIHSEETFLTGGATPSAIQEPILGDAQAGKPSIYLVTYPNNLCMVIALKGAGASCYVALLQADGSLIAEQSIVDGKRFVHGLVANNVTALTVSVAATATTPATTVPAAMENNAFIAPLPYHGGFELGAVTITLTRGDGSTATTDIPALHGPPPARHP